MSKVASKSASKVESLKKEYSSVDKKVLPSTTGGKSVESAAVASAPIEDEVNFDTLRRLFVCVCALAYISKIFINRKQFSPPLLILIFFSFSSSLNYSCFNK